MLMELFKESMAYKPKKTLLLFGQMLLSFVAFGFTLSLFSTYTTSVNRLNHVTKQMYKISDNYHGEEESKFFSRADNVGALKALYQWEKTQTTFNYVVMSRQNVSVENKNWPKQCSIDYNDEEAKNIYQSIQVNPEFFRYFDIHLSEGEMFCDDDYTLDENIPLLMGSDYKGVCTIGEDFELYYLGTVLHCTITGFVEENSYINSGEEIEYLNNLIILPSLELKDGYEHGFGLRLYLDKTSGFIQTNEEIAALQNELTQRCIDLDLLPFTIEGCNGFFLSMWGLEGQQLRTVFLSMLIMVFTTTIICLSLNYSLKIRRFKKNYAICISNGIRRNSIIRSIVFEIFLLNLIAAFIAYVCCFVFGFPQKLWIAFLVAVIVTMIAAIYPISCFNKLNLATALRGKD